MTIIEVAMTTFVSYKDINSLFVLVSDYHHCLLYSDHLGPIPILPKNDM